MDSLERDGIRVEWSDGISRWGKYGKERLYLPGKGGNSVDLLDLESEIEFEFVNPYGWNSKRLFADGQRIGIRHEWRGEYVEIRRI